MPIFIQKGMNIDSFQNPINNMQKTVVCHFYNEEYLLPWWLKHHSKIFDHGIMIDYKSTDRSRELINLICPTWEIRDSRNEFFDSIPIDQEVMDIEKTITGWRIALNVTEFLYGNTDRLVHRDELTQYLLRNYVFVDMEDETKHPKHLLHDLPLYTQRYWGYIPDTHTKEGPGGVMPRLNRSIHNFPIEYKGGRHFGNTNPSFDDLVIFYYGWADISDRGLQRKLQIAPKSTEGGSVHLRTREQFMKQYHDARPICEDLREKMISILAFNQQITGQGF